LIVRRHFPKEQLDDIDHYLCLVKQGDIEEAREYHNACTVKYGGLIFCSAFPYQQKFLLRWCLCHHSDQGSSVLTKSSTTGSPWKLAIPLEEHLSYAAFASAEYVKEKKTLPPTIRVLMEYMEDRLKWSFRRESMALGVLRKGQQHKLFYVNAAAVALQQIQNSKTPAVNTLTGSGAGIDYKNLFRRVDGPEDFTASTNHSYLRSLTPDTGSAGNGEPMQRSATSTDKDEVTSDDSTRSDDSDDLAMPAGRPTEANHGSMTMVKPRATTAASAVPALRTMHMPRLAESDEHEPDALSPSTGAKINMHATLQLQGKGILDSTSQQILAGPFDYKPVSIAIKGAKGWEKLAHDQLVRFDIPKMLGPENSPRVLMNNSLLLVVSKESGLKVSPPEEYRDATSGNKAVLQTFVVGVHDNGSRNDFQLSGLASVIEPLLEQLHAVIEMVRINDMGSRSTPNTKRVVTPFELDLSKPTTPKKAATLVICHVKDPGWREALAQTKLPHGITVHVL
jgi:hypothetical protein